MLTAAVLKFISLFLFISFLDSSVESALMTEGKKRLMMVEGWLDAQCMPLILVFHVTSHCIIIAILKTELEDRLY